MLSNLLLEDLRVYCLVLIDNIATEGRFPTSTLSGRGDTMSRKTVREEMMTQQVLQQSSGRTGE